MSQENPASISSGETAPSKPSPSVVALGERIVKELGLTEGSDTLGKWMAHRIAELMELAENAENQPEREAAQREVENLILRVWDRRERWPGGYPLQGLEKAVEVLNEEVKPYWDRRNPTNRDPWLRMLQRLQTLHQREATICRFSAIVGIPLEKEREWAELHHASEAELALIEKLVLFQDQAKGEYFTLDGQRIPNFGSHPPEERARLALEALQKIARERGELLDGFVLEGGEDEGDETEAEEFDDKETDGEEIDDEHD